MIDPTTATGDGFVHWFLSACIALLGAERTWIHFRARLGHGRRNGSSAFDNRDEYWSRMQQTMKESVTDPLAKVLDRQTEILSDQVKGNNDILTQLARIDERTKLR